MVKVIIILLTTLTIFATKQQKAEDILATMTLNEKIGQMVLVYHSHLEFLQKHHVGGVLVMQNMVNKDLKIKNELATIQKNLKIPLLVCIDQEGGTINRLGNIKEFKNFPSAFELSTKSNSKISNFATKATTYLNNIGINTNLAPCLDPTFNYNNDTTFMLIRERSFGKTAEDIIEKGGAFLKGINKVEGFSFLKHFPGYDVKSNSDEHISISTANLDDLENYILPFKTLCKASSGIMMNNIIYKNIDSLPAVLSPKIVKKAREVCNEQVIMTDDLWAVSIRSFVNPGKKIYRSKYPDAKFMKIAELAFLAGNDILMVTFPKKVPLIIKAIKKSVTQNPKLLESVDNSVLRILKLKLKLKNGWN